MNKMELPPLLTQYHKQVSELEALLKTQAQKITKLEKRVDMVKPKVHKSLAEYLRNHCSTEDERIEECLMYLFCPRFREKSWRTMMEGDKWKKFVEKKLTEHILEYEKGDENMKRLVMILINGSDASKRGYQACQNASEDQQLGILSKFFCFYFLI